MRIVYITPEFPSEDKFIGGLGNYIYRVAKLLIKHGHDVEVIVLSTKKNGRQIYDGIKIVNVRRGGRNFLTFLINLVTAKKFQRALGLVLDSILVSVALKNMNVEKAIDIVQVPSILPCSLFIKWLSPNLPYVIRISSYRPYWHRFMRTPKTANSRLEERLESVQLKQAPFIFSPSSTLKAILLKEEGVKVDVIRPPFFLETDERDLSIYERKLLNKKYFLFFGKADVHKGFEILVQAAPSFFAKYPDAYLVFVGRQETSQFSAKFSTQTQALLREYSSRIINLPPQRHPSLYPIIEGAKLVVLPSLIDNIPNTCLEAMGLGKPVLGTIGASFDELIEDGKTGFLVNAGDAKALSLKLDEAWAHARLEEIGKSARDFIEQEFSPVKAIDGLLEYYKSAVAAWEVNQQAKWKISFIVFLLETSVWVFMTTGGIMELFYKLLRKIKSLVKRVFSIVRVLMDQDLQRFNRVKRDADGMLPVNTYRMMYDSMLVLPDLDVVEVGGAAGASSIALALGMQDSHKKSSLVVVEKCEGGSRLPHGGYENNYARIVQNLKSYQMWERIRLFPHYLTFENGAEVQALVKTPQIAGLIHDADGRVDRDFHLFWERLVPNGLIIIDDCEDKPEYREISPRYPDGGTKKITTYRLVQLFLEWGLLKIDKIERGTVFAHKPLGADFSKFNLAQCEAAVAQIFAEREAYFQGK